MENSSRRSVLRTATALGTASVAGALSMSTAQAAESEGPGPSLLGGAPTAAPGGPAGCRWTEEERKDRERVLRAGFTAEEADCWLLVNRAAAAFLALPEQHPSDLPEGVQSWHVIQRTLLARPAYRLYRGSDT
ncbi:hypothetical protein [Streptomyces sp. NPDC005805]|uniref:hypothetical protein n=1 Tax=Streptomyces sp. NPDC005805 TaxID=3157068 RepID=UPI0033FCCDE2